MNKIYFIVFCWFLFQGCRPSKLAVDEFGHLETMASFLNSEIPQFKVKDDPLGFYVQNGRPKNFFVYDLVDTAKNSYQPYPPRAAVTIAANGVYHFSPRNFRFSYSHIAVISGGKMKIFRLLNCAGGDKIEDVISFVKTNLNYDDEIRRRILNYRLHGIYFKTDPQSRIECP